MKKYYYKDGYGKLREIKGREPVEGLKRFFNWIQVDTGLKVLLHDNHVFYKEVEEVKDKE